MTEDTDLSADDLKEVVKRFKAVYKKEGKAFPEDPYEQLRYGINAVFESWESERAILYRKVQKMTDLAGTAVNVQVTLSTRQNFMCMRESKNCVE